MDRSQLSRVRSLCITAVGLNTRGFLTPILSHFLKLVNHYHLVKCIPSSRCGGILCLENNFTPEPRADLIFTKGHADLICNIEQYHINKKLLELHPRMRSFLQPTEFEDLSTDEDKLGN